MSIKLCLGDMSSNYIMKRHSSKGKLNIKEQEILKTPNYKMIPLIRTLKLNIYDFTLGL